jgi:hypothetical protein
MSRVITSWQENGMQYTITATPIIEQTAPTSSGNKTEMLSVFDYLGGKTPPHGTGEKVYKYATNSRAKVESKEVTTTKYTGKVMLYERQMLDVYFNQNTTAVPVAPVANIPKQDLINSYEDDDLPF